jgi:hypothetical protein
LFPIGLPNVFGQGAMSPDLLVTGELHMSSWLRIRIWSDGQQCKQFIATVDFHREN